MALLTMDGQGVGEVLRNSGPKETNKESKIFLRQPGCLLASLRAARSVEAGGSPMV